MVKCEYCAFRADACESCVEREKIRKEKQKQQAKKNRLWAKARNDAMKSIGLTKTKHGWE